MKLVIDIPDAIKEMADEDDKKIIHLMWMLILVDAIKNGVVLPKGHGRLIDADAVLKEIIYAQKSLESNNDSRWEMNKPYFKGLAWAHRIVLDIPTVIEADKEGVE